VEGRAVERWAEQVAAEAGFTAVDHTIELFGLCPQCSKDQCSKDEDSQDQRAGEPLGT
jgi:Fur family ferric uptake transcriptional regulator